MVWKWVLNHQTRKITMIIMKDTSMERHIQLRKYS